MSLTININDLSLCHKGSNGVSTATLPDMCNTPTPTGPAPMAYPNVAMSSDLAKGTTTITADGGNMCANYGSEFSKSTGDEPGSLGGVTSGTFIKEATWITYSFDVKLEGKAACRLTDKMFHNHQNTVNMAGVLQPHIIAAHPGVVGELQTLCNMMCDVKNVPGKKQDLIAARLKALDKATGGKSTMKAEVPFDPTNVTPYMSKTEPWRATGNWWIPGHRRPDVVITNGGPPRLENIRAVVEMKFNDGSTGFSKDQLDAYDKMFGEKLITMEEGKDCKCDDDDKKLQPEPVPVYVPESSWWKRAKQVALIGAVGVLAVATVAAAVVPFDGPVGEVALGSATAATWAAAFAR